MSTRKITRFLETTIEIYGIDGLSCSRGCDWFQSTPDKSWGAACGLFGVPLGEFHEGRICRCDECLAHFSEVLQ